jgi:hypothetical protein
MHNHAFIPTVWSGGRGVKLCSFLQASDLWSMVKSEMENIMKAGLED